MIINSVPNLLHIEYNKPILGMDTEAGYSNTTMIACDSITIDKNIIPDIILIEELLEYIFTELQKHMKILV